MGLIDFTDCEIDKLAVYMGSDQKRGIWYNGKRYMLKWSDRIPDEKRSSLNSSYSNSVFSEYIGCNIAKILGFDVQNTLLGTINMNAKNTNSEPHTVIACENFVPSGKKLIEFKIIENALLSTKPPKIPQIEHIYEIMAGDNAYFTKEFGKIALQQYWDIFILDALLGNFDRHANNWGYLVDENTKKIELAPVYDCGSCLYPQVADDAIMDIFDNPEELQKRIDVFPNAALVIEGKKVSYKKYISEGENEDCTKALLRIFPRIDMQRITDFILGIDEISELRKNFYIKMLHERYEQILKTPYLKLMNKQKDNEQHIKVRRYHR